MELEIAIAEYLEDIIRPIIKSIVEDAVTEGVLKALDIYQKDDLITVKEACKLLRFSATVCHSVELRSNCSVYHQSS